MKEHIKYFFIILLFFPVFTFSQELSAQIAIDYSSVQTSNVQVFRTLEKNLKDFINNTKWTTNNLKAEERIKCSFAFIITEVPRSNEYKAKLNIQSSRPVYNSVYQTPIINYKDEEITFGYVEHESLVFNDRKFSGKNLTDVVSFYVYLILGLDADSFSMKGGDKYYQIAQKISGNSINQNYSGWNTFDGPRTRGSLIAEYTTNKSDMLRKVIYQYHRNGLDNMFDNEKDAKETIYKNLKSLEAYKDSHQFYSLSTFIDTKKDEISNIFSGGIAIPVNITQLTEIMTSISPTNSDYWNKIKN